MDLAEVTVTTLLSVEVKERTRCSLENHPPTIGIPRAKTIYDYNSVAYLRSKVYPASSKMSSSKPRSHISKEQAMEETQYSIRVQTGDRKGAGTDAKVSLTITGNEAMHVGHVHEESVGICSSRLTVATSTRVYPLKPRIKQLQTSFTFPLSQPFVPNC